MGDADELGLGDYCILFCLALYSLLGALSSAIRHGGVPGSRLQLHSLCKVTLSAGGGRGGSFQSSPQEEGSCFHHLRAVSLVSWCAP